nr:Rv3654c family TadE-like protein [Actinomyces vulturis]
MPEGRRGGNHAVSPKDREAGSHTIVDENRRFGRIRNDRGGYEPGKRRISRQCRLYATFFQDDKGAGAVMVTSVIAVLLIIAIAVMSVSGLAIAATRARNAADLAAIAGATNAIGLYGDIHPCLSAQQVAKRNGANLSSCQIDGNDVIVSVEVPVSALLIHDAARAVARAGPQDSPP